MTTPAYKKFKEIIEDPLNNISQGNGFLTNPIYLPGSIKHEAGLLKKGTQGRRLPAIIAAYAEDVVNSQKQQPKMNRLEKDSYEIISNRTVIIHGVVKAFETGEKPGDYIEDIDNLLYDVKKALSAKELSFTQVGFILDNDDETMGLAGFSLKVNYKIYETMQYD